MIMHELGVGVLNTPILTLEKLSEILLFTVMSALFFVSLTSDKHGKFLTFGLDSGQRLIRRLEMVDWGHLPTEPFEFR